MRPQDIVEEEEMERIKALLQRENLIRSLGIVEQLTRLLNPTRRVQRKLHEYRVRVFTCFLQNRGRRATLACSDGKAQEAQVPASGQFRQAVHAGWLERVCFSLSQAPLVLVECSFACHIPEVCSVY